MDPEVVDASDWGWTGETGKWQPLWKHFSKCQNRVMNSFVVDVRKAALVAASAKRQHSSVLHCASVQEIAK